MSLFRRKKTTEVVEIEPDEAELARQNALQEEDDAERAALARVDAAERLRQRQGPKDSTELSGDDAERIDLGALLIVPQEGMELRMEMVEEDQSVRSITAVLADSQVQIQVFAAPRRAGVWDDIRDELSEEIQRQGGEAEERHGTFGEEILARLPVRTPDGRTGHQATRFVGVDGPRWFLRGVISGRAAVDPEAYGPVETMLKTCVVHRGPDALPPRDLLPMQLPAGAQRVEEPAEEAAPTAMAPPQRGPEITEIR